MKTESLAESKGEFAHNHSRLAVAKRGGACYDDALTGRAPPADAGAACQAPVTHLRFRRRKRLLYRGGAGQWAWVLHRLTGLGVLLFLVLHVLDTALVLFGPEVYDKVIALYRHPVVRVSEVGLAAAVLYHALNGIRITLIDFYPELSDRQQQLFYGVVGVFLLLFLPGAYLMLEPLF